MDDQSTVSAFTTFPEDSIYLNKPPAQLPDDDKSEYQLTHWQVPQHGDYSRPYCTACHFTDCERCTYCFSHKLTRTPRMHMERLGEALLHMNPDMMGKEMLHILQRYARADKFALDLNWRLGWVPPEGAFCNEHQKTIDHLEAIEAEASVKYEQTLKELQKERKMRQKAEKACEKATHALELEHVDEGDLRHLLKKVTMQFHDLEHQHQEVVEDLKHMKVNVVKCMKKGSVEEMRGALHRCVRKLDSGHTEVHEHVDSGTNTTVELHHESSQSVNPGELRALYAAQGDSFGDREWNALWGADFGDQGLDEQTTIGRPQTGTSVQRQASPTPMVQHSFDLKEAQDAAEILRQELSIPDAPWETISEVAGGTHGYPEMAAEAAEEVRPQCGEVHSYDWDVLRGFGESQSGGGCRMTNRDAALQERKRLKEAGFDISEEDFATLCQSGEGDKVEAKNAEVIRKELLDKGAPVTAHTWDVLRGLKPMIILHKSPEAVAEDMRHTLEHKGVRFSEGDWNTIRGATGSGADGARAAEELRRDYAAKGFSFSAGDWDKLRGMEPSQVPDSKREEMSKKGVTFTDKEWIVLQNATQRPEEAEELRRAKECEGVHIDAWDWDQLRGVRHAVVVDNKTLALEKRCSALKSENDRIRRELQKLQKMRNDVRRRAAALPRPMVLHVNQPEKVIHETEIIEKDHVVVVPMASGVEHHEHLEEHAHLDFADDSTQTDDAAFSSSPAKPDAHAHHREEHVQQIVKSSKGGPLGHLMKRTKSFSGKLEAGAGEEEHKDDHEDDDHDHEDHDDGEHDGEGDDHHGHRPHSKGGKHGNRPGSSEHGAHKGGDHDGDGHHGDGHHEGSHGNHSKGSKHKRGSPKKHSKGMGDMKRVDLKHLIPMLGDIYEKKLEKDTSELSGKSKSIEERETKPLASFLMTYMVDHYGVKNIAKARLRQFIGSVMHWAESSRRVRNFAKLCGVWPGREHDYVRDLGDIFLHSLLHIIPKGAIKGVGEILKSHQDGDLKCSCRQAVHSLVGMAKSCNLKQPRTYDCPLLASWLTPQQLLELVNRLLALTEDKACDCGAHLGFVSDPVDLDMFHEVVIDTLMDAVSQQETMLARTFTKFEGLDDDEGLAFDEYEAILNWAVPAAYTLEERQKQFKALLRSAGDEDNDGDIDNAGDFAIAVMRTTKNPLVHPRTTRRYWMLPWDLEV